MQQENNEILTDALKHLSYHKLEIRFSPSQNISSRSWLGSYIRNNLLHAKISSLDKVAYSSIVLIR